MYNAKNKIHRQWDTALDLPLNSHVDIKGNLLQPVRRIRIFSLEVLNLQSVLH